MGLAIVGGVFTLVLTGYVVVDGLTGAVGAVRMLSHLPALAGVVAVPGGAFHHDRDAARSLLRFAFCKRDDVLHQALDRLATADLSA